MEAALVGSLGRIAIGTTKVTIGRASDNTVVLSDAKVSSHHAELRPEGQSYNLVDLGSTNGTFVNERRISSGIPCPLRTGDALRLGDSRFTFEVKDFPQGVSVSDGSTVRSVPPQLLGGAMPNPVANTGYGMSNSMYGGQSNYQETLPAQAFDVAPPRPQYSDQQSPYAPSQLSYVPEAQMPTYVSPPSNQPASQQAFTPLPQQPPRTPPSVYNPPAQPQQPRKRSMMRAIIVGVIVLVVVLASVGSFFIFHNNQVAQDHSNATATAQTSATNATATARARQIATATAIATSNYPPFTSVSLDESLTSAGTDWSASSTCHFGTAGLQISLAQTNSIQYCSNSGQYSQMAYQVTMAITQGNCGGLAFRFLDAQDTYIFAVCQNGTYNIIQYYKNQSFPLYTQPRASANIQQGLNKPNTIAVTVQGNTVNAYVNGKNIDTATSAALTSSLFSQGKIALLAVDTSNPTTVVYTNALVWTAS